MPRVAMINNLFYRSIICKFIRRKRTFCVLLGLLQMANTFNWNKADIGHLVLTMKKTHIPLRIFQKSTGVGSHTGSN